MSASGCGTTGGTTRETVALAETPAAGALVPIQVDTVTIAPEGAELYAIGTYAWGRFDKSDLANIRGSLEDTLAAAAKSKQLDPSDRVRVSLLLRRYVVASTNMEVAVLAAVDWCAARNDGTAIYRDVFYAAYSKMLLATLGSGKAAVNRAIVRRVAESSLLLAAGVPADGSLPRKLEGTYETLEEAAATLPSHMASAGTAVPFGSTLLFLPSTGSADIPWWKAESPAATPCQSLLGQEGA
jgi:hypothetical protein